MKNKTIVSQRWSRRPEGSNWGEFGADDQTGRLNLITPKMRRAAVSEVREGVCFLLSLPLDYPGGESENAFRRAPKLFTRKWGDEICYNMRVGQAICSDDHVIMSLQYSTQWDGLAHCGAFFDVDGSGTQLPVYYNGWRAHEHITGPIGDHPPCAHKLGVENMALTGVQGRGILFDLVRAFGAGHRLITYDDLMRVVDDQRIEVRKGDFLLFYTGYGDAVMAGGKQPQITALAQADMALDGSDRRLLEWIDSSGAVSLIADNPAVEHVNSSLDYRTHDLLPLHQHCIFKLGMHLGELFWLSDLAAYLRSAGRHAFLFTGPPLRLPGAAGSPVSPVATV